MAQKDCFSLKVSLVICCFSFPQPDWVLYKRGRNQGRGGQPAYNTADGGDALMVDRHLLGEHEMLSVCPGFVHLFFLSSSFSPSPTTSSATTVRCILFLCILFVILPELSFIPTLPPLQ